MFKDSKFAIYILFDMIYLFESMYICICVFAQSEVSSFLHNQKQLTYIATKIIKSNHFDIFRLKKIAHVIHNYTAAIMYNCIESSLGTRRLKIKKWD